MGVGERGCVCAEVGVVVGGCGRVWVGVVVVVGAILRSYIRIRKFRPKYGEPTSVADRLALVVHVL